MKSTVFPAGSILQIFHPHPKPRRLARALLPAALLLAVLLLPGLPAQAREPALRVELVREVSADASMAEVELEVVNDGLQGELYLEALAKSRDGEVRGGPTLTPEPLPAGRKVRFSVFVSRPPDVGTQHAGAQHTEVLLVAVQTGAGKWVAHTRAEWAHDWPALPQPNAAQAGAAAGAGNDGLLPRSNEAGVVAGNLADGDFAALDLLLQEWSTPQARDESGEWKLASFDDAIATLAGQNHWEDGMAFIRRWKRFNPHSPGAAVAEARLGMAHAWAAVGRCACGATARPDAVARGLFNARMKGAERALLASKKYAAANPLWYQAYLDLAVDSGRSESFVRKLFEEAIGRHPGYAPLYISMANYWAPNDDRPAHWDELEQLAGRAAALTRATDGDDNYAWLYAQVGARLPLDVDMMRVSEVSWPRMRDAFRELVRRHPSVDNYNRFALYACRAGDRETYLTLAPKIRDHAAPDLWPGNYSRDLCDHRFMQQS
jgi:hypothetical protein